MTELTETEIKSELRTLSKSALLYFVNLTNQRIKASEQKIDSSNYLESPRSVSDSYLKVIEFIFEQFKPTNVEIKITNQEPDYGNEWTISKIQFDNEQGETGSLTLRQEGYAYPRIDLRIESKVEKPEIERRLDATLKVSLSSIDRYANPKDWEIVCEAHSRIPIIIDDKMLGFYLFESSNWGRNLDLVCACYWNTADLPGEFCSYIDNGEYGDLKDDWYMRNQRGDHTTISGRGAIKALRTLTKSSKTVSSDDYVQFFVEGSNQCRALVLATEFYSAPSNFIKCYTGVETHCMPEYAKPGSISSSLKRVHIPPASPKN